MNGEWMIEGDKDNKEEEESDKREAGVRNEGGEDRKRGFSFSRDKRKEEDKK